MDKDQLINLIEITLKVTEEVASNSKYLKVDEEPLLTTRKVLVALKAELINSPNDIRERVLRAMHDLGMSAYKEFENTPLENALTNLISLLSKEVPKYKTLQPLRNDFGKDDPA